MKTVAIIQAHMGSTRLPGKVMCDIEGSSMLARVVRRTRRARKLDQVVVACATDPVDDVLLPECAKLGVEVFRGSDTDVLDRYLGAASHFQATTIVRITSDCPLIDPEIIDQVVAAFEQAGPDYAANILQRTYPRGLDTEVFRLSGLERCWGEAREKYQRVHVTPYFYQNPDKFRLLNVFGVCDYSPYRWTVDTPEDLEFVRRIYRHLGSDETFSWIKVLALVRGNPELLELNRQVQQKSLHEG